MSEEKPTNGNVVQLQRNEKVEAITEFIQLTVKAARPAPPEPAAIVATLELQGLQLEVMMRMLFEGAPLTADEFSRRLTLRCRQAVQAIKARPAIVVAKDLPPS